MSLIHRKVFFFLPVPECIWCLASFLSVAICVQSNLCFLLSGKMLCVCVHMCACTSESVNTLCFNLRLSLSLTCLLDHELFAERVLPKSTVFWMLSCLIFFLETNHELWSSACFMICAKLPSFFFRFKTFNQAFPEALSLYNNVCIGSWMKRRLGYLVMCNCMSVVVALLMV